jgi:predicted acylesterase/phospholipase RssA
VGCVDRRNRTNGFDCGFDSRLTRPDLAMSAMTYKTKLCWKITARLQATSSDYSKPTKLFNIQSGNSIVKDIGGGLVSQFVPVVLAPTAAFHASIEKEKEAHGFRGKKFPYQLKSESFPQNGEFNVNVAIHVYNSSYVVMTFEVDAFTIDEPLPSLIDLRELKSHAPLLWLARRLLHIVVSGKSKPIDLWDVPSAIPCIYISEGANVPRVSRKDAVEALTGHRGPSELVIDSVIAKNAGHQTVENGLLLVDKQGIFFSFPSETSIPGKYGPERIFLSACGSLEIALATTHLLSTQDVKRELNTAQLETLNLMVKKPARAMPKSISAQKIWLVICKEFYLEDLLAEHCVQPTQQLVHSATKAKHELALIMKGGGVKGLALAGAIVELQKKYAFTTYVGTSAGAIAAVLLAAGVSGDELKELLEKKSFRDFVNEGILTKVKNLFFQNGWHSGNELTSWVQKILHQKLPQQGRIEMTHLPNRAVVYAASADKGTVTFDSTGENKNSPAAFATRCSMSIPYLFIPNSHHGTPVFDGGLLNNYPVKIFLEANPNSDFIALYLVGGPSNSNLRKSMFGNLIDIVTGRDEKYVADLHRQCTIAVDPWPIKTTDFSLTRSEKDFLVLQGKIAAMQFINNKTPSQDLHHQIVSLTERSTELRAEIRATRSKNTTRWVLLFVIAALAMLSATTFGRAIFSDPVHPVQVILKKILP